MNSLSHDCSDPKQTISKIGRIAIVAGAFVLGFCLCLFGCDLLVKLFSPGANDQAEVMRVTSPDNRLDAVMTEVAYRGIGDDFLWCVTIVQKGKSAPMNCASTFFQASTIDNEKLVWKEPHRLDILFRSANIRSYRNVWELCEIEHVSPIGEDNFRVEIRLVPESPDFSVLTSRGGFQ